jgi:dTDP-4-dehydrorhamnose reductase
MKILITGCSGLVGSHLALALASEHQVLALRHSDLDITDGPAVRRLARAVQPSLIINCAVIGVDECQMDPPLAKAVNIVGPRNLAEASSEIGAEFLHFSSNYVFGGSRTDGVTYTTNDEARPINIYGQTKLEGEHIARAISTRTYILRTSWVFGSGKPSFLSTAYDRLSCRVSIRAITDTWACTTYVGDLVRRTKEILARRHYGVYQIVNQGTISQHDFALECARLAGLSTAEAERLIESVTEEELGRLAPRPSWTPMSCLLSARLGLTPLRDWRLALADYVRRDSSEN